MFILLFTKSFKRLPLRTRPESSSSSPLWWQICHSSFKSLHFSSPLMTFASHQVIFKEISHALLKHFNCFCPIHCKNVQSCYPRVSTCTAAWWVFCLRHSLGTRAVVSLLLSFFVLLISLHALNIWVTAFMFSSLWTNRDLKKCSSKQKVQHVCIQVWNRKSGAFVQC